MSVFERPCPRLSDDRLAELAATHYSVTGRIRGLDSERDQNALIDGGGARHVLKIANAAEDPRFLALQNAVLDHIAAVDPDLGVPRVARAADGRTIVAAATAGETHQLRLLSWLPGELFSAVPKSPALFESLGRFMGRLSRALRGFGHPAAHRPEFLWNLDGALAVRPWLADIGNPAERDLAARALDRFEVHVAPRLGALRAAVIHQDANDNNLIVTGSAAPTVSGLIDFGDMAFGRQISELAVTIAYAVLGERDLVGTAAAVIGGYAREFPIEAGEAEILFGLLAARLAMSVAISSHRSKTRPGNAYLLVSRQTAFETLARLDRVNPAFLSALARHAAGLPAVAAHDRIVAWLSSADCKPRSLFDYDLARAGRIRVALQPRSPGMEHGADPRAYWAWLEGRMRDAGARYAIGLYGEDRDVYKGPQFASPMTGGYRSRHLGLDLFVPAGTPLNAPLAGRVSSVQDNALPYDYGPTVILEHQAGDGGPAFFTLHGHLARETLTRLRPGQEVAAGERIGSIGEPEENGGWAPHLHFQLMTDRLGLTGEFPGVGEPELFEIWSKIAPDPNLLLRLAPESFLDDPHPPEALQRRRAVVLSPSLSLSYRDKLKIVRGRGCYLYDHAGRAYLDCVNNICHVGHSHPRVVEALARQAAVLNTNTRYLHEAILDYAERLAATLPAPLSRVFMVCSGSEANELALRIARTVTGRQATICLDWGYHGNTNGLIAVSPYKFNRNGGGGKPDDVEVAALPDPYRGPHKGYGAEAGLAYAGSVAAAIAAIEARTGAGPAAFIAEAISGCGGQVVFPDGYFDAAFAAVRKSGGLVIVDEVQTGFGRVGKHMWAFELQGVVPDIVTLGKPIGNGHPMAAVVTTAEIAQHFANGMEFFSSFGGNPVSAAVGLAVLGVIGDERLQERALATGNHLKARLAALAGEHPIIGDVRGEGLFLGVELVEDRATLAPATEAAADVINGLRQRGVLVATDGPDDNVLKIKPPMTFGIAEAEILVAELRQVLGTL